MNGNGRCREELVGLQPFNQIFGSEHRIVFLKCGQMFGETLYAGRQRIARQIIDSMIEQDTPASTGSASMPKTDKPKNTEVINHQVRKRLHDVQPLRLLLGSNMESCFPYLPIFSCRGGARLVTG